METTTIKFPVFLLAKDCGEFRKFNTALEMQRNVERIDVENQEYEAWDSNGVEVQLLIQEPVWLSLVSRPEGKGPAELLDAVNQYARSARISISGRLSVDEVGPMIDRIRTGLEEQKIANSPIRRFLNRIT